MIRVKIQKHFENERRKCKGNVSGYRKGRPKNSLDGLRGPRGEMWQNEDTDKDLDMVSYKANCALLLEQVKANAGCTILRPLWKLTFQGRRYEIIQGMVADPYQILSTRCPILNQQLYLHAEFDMIVGEGASRTMNENWRKFVPSILSIARKLPNKPVQSLLSSYGECEQFDLQSCLDVELLPVLIKSNRRGKCSRYLSRKQRR